MLSLGIYSVPGCMMKMLMFIIWLIIIIKDYHSCSKSNPRLWSLARSFPSASPFRACRAWCSQGTYEPDPSKEIPLFHWLNSTNSILHSWRTRALSPPTNPSLLVWSSHWTSAVRWSDPSIQDLGCCFSNSCSSMPTSIHFRIWLCWFLRSQMEAHTLITHRDRRPGSRSQFTCCSPSSRPFRVHSRRVCLHYHHFTWHGFADFAFEWFFG